MNIIKALVGPFVFVVTFSLSLAATGLAQYKWQSKIKDTTSDLVTPPQSTITPSVFRYDEESDDPLTPINERLGEVPPDLTSPARDNRYVVPESAGKTSATYSGYQAERREQRNPTRL